MKTVGVVVLLLALTLSGCSALGSDGPEPVGLEGRTFLSTGVIRDGQSFALVPGTTVQLVFGPNGNLAASAGCNHIGGTYRIDGTTLRFEGGGMTAMGCDPARHAQDDWLAGFLGGNPSVELAGNDLVLSTGAWTVRLADREVVEPDLPLAGPVWTVTAIIDGDAVSSIPAGLVATLQFGDDGRVGIRTGCNDAGASYAVDGGTIRFRDLVTTDVACPGPRGQLEQAVLAVLAAPSVDWSVEAFGLTLRAGEAGLMLVGGPAPASAG